MKKISSVMLAVLMLIMSLMSVPVSAEFSADDITIETNVYNVLVTVVAENDGTMTAKLTSEDGNNLYSMKSDRAPEETANGYKYEFLFRMGADVSTDTYAVTVGNVVDKTTKTFNYVRLGDKIEFYTALDTKAAGTIKQFFADNASIVPVDLTIYNGLDEETILPKVDAEIVALNLNPNISDGDSDAQKEEKVSAVDEIFTAKFLQLMDIAKVASANESEWQALAEGKLGGLFDDYFYDEETAGTGVLSVTEVYESYKKEASQAEEFTLDAYGKAFDRATLMQIEKSRSFGMLKDAFVYFNNKGIITPDMTDIQALIDANKDAQLWKDLIDMENADCAALVNNAEAIASRMMDASTSGNSGSGITGGGSTAIDRPTGSGGGGGSMGSSPSKPSTPEVSEPDTPDTTSGTFSDIENVEWAKEAIEALAEKGVINGKADGVFAPNDSVTREEFVKIVIGAFDLLNEEATAEFGDVDADRWSYVFIATANELGIVTGDGTLFNPTGAMSRQDMAVVLMRTAEKLGLTLSGDAEDFADAEEIADYAKAAVKALTASGIINGMGDGTFAPKATVTRAQAAKVIYGLLDLVGGGK